MAIETTSEQRLPNSDKLTGILPVQAEVIEAIPGALVPEQQPATVPDVNNEAVVAADADQENSPSWLKKHYMKLALGSLVVGSAIAIATNPLGSLEKDVEAAAPWALGGIAATETLWIGGAALMTTSAGKKIGNPLTLHNRWNEISNDIANSTPFKVGLIANTVGALGTAGIVAIGAVTSLPVETWPGALSLAAADIASTVAVRGGVYAALNKAKAETPEKEKAPKVTVRLANIDDMGRLADIDLELFGKAYGDALPPKSEVVDMLTKRFNNSPATMHVAELEGIVEGFVTGFLTNVPLEDFVSWEECTANGTLDGKVDPNGKYAYVANMTIKHEAVKNGAEDMLLANLFADGIGFGIEYAYFVARMPHFKRWLEVQDKLGKGINEDNTLQQSAERYLDLRIADGRRYDPQLRMYEGLGFELKRLVPKGFEDEASMDYGVVFKADVPPSARLKKIKPVRQATAAALRLVAKNPRLLRRVF